MDDELFFEDFWVYEGKAFPNSQQIKKNHYKNLLCCYKELLKVQEKVIGSNFIGSYFRIPKYSNCTSRKTINFIITIF